MIFLGNGEYSDKEVKKLHEQVDKAISVLSAVQHPLPCTMERTRDYTESKRDLEHQLQTLIWDIAESLGLSRTEWRIHSLREEIVGILNELERKLYQLQIDSSDIFNDDLSEDALDPIQQLWKKADEMYVAMNDKLERDPFMVIKVLDQLKQDLLRIQNDYDVDSNIIGDCLQSAQEIVNILSGMAERSAP